MQDHVRSSTCRIRPWTIVALLTGLVGLFSVPGYVHGGDPIRLGDFTQAAPQGLDAANATNARQNSWPWSMQWWKGHLYVGTNRAYRCATEAQLASFVPGVAYPPNDPDLLCTPDPKDLPLQAEIWRWTPPQAGDTDITDNWELVYRAPADVPIPGTDPVKYVARDVGYRGMSVFREPNGAEALYVSSVSPRGLGYFKVTEPPRILRSTDGRLFEPLPQAPGTVLGDFPQAGFRDQASFNGRFYVVGTSIYGSGVLLESSNPAAGNNTFREVGPPNTLVVDVAPFNGYLYVGTNDHVNGYRVIKSDLSGPLPYTWTEVIPNGAYLTDDPSVGAGTLHVFRNRLYVGTDGGNIGGAHPAEIIRINPDDSWDLVVGNGRDTPTGRKEPISGQTAGFGEKYNQHIWAMADYEDYLYVGTYDSSINEKDNPATPPNVRDRMGAALYRSADGVTFDPITIDGFDTPQDPHDGMFNIGVRHMSATPYGLFVGLANHHYGLNIYRGGALQPKYQIYTPMIMK